jgi:hypothetical protein
MVENHYHIMKMKMYKDQQKKEAKAQKFLEKKEREEETVEVKGKDIKKLLKEIENLKLKHKALSKNVQGKKDHPKKRSSLPKDKKADPKKTKGNSTKGSNTNGRKKSTSIKRQY